MKDAFGHGSAGKGLASAIAQRNSMFGAGAKFQTLRDPTSNAEAGQALMSTLKSTQAPVHDSMGGYNGSAPISQTQTTRTTAGNMLVNSIRKPGRSFGDGLKIRGLSNG